MVFGCVDDRVMEFKQHSIKYIYNYLTSSFETHTNASIEYLAEPCSPLLTNDQVNDLCKTILHLLTTCHADFVSEFIQSIVNRMVCIVF